MLTDKPNFRLYKYLTRIQNKKLWQAKLLIMSWTETSGWWTAIQIMNCSASNKKFQTSIPISRRRYTPSVSNLECTTVHSIYYIKLTHWHSLSSVSTFAHFRAKGSGKVLPKTIENKLPSHYEFSKGFTRNFRRNFCSNVCPHQVSWTVYYEDFVLDDLFTYPYSFEGIELAVWSKLWRYCFCQN